MSEVTSVGDAMSPRTPGGKSDDSSGRGPPYIKRTCRCCGISGSEVDRGQPAGTEPTDDNRQPFASFPNHILCLDCCLWKKTDPEVTAIEKTNLAFAKRVQSDKKLVERRDNYLPQYAEQRLKRGSGKAKDVDIKQMTEPKETLDKEKATEALLLQDANMVVLEDWLEQNKGKDPEQEGYTVQEVNMGPGKEQVPCVNLRKKGHFCLRTQQRESVKLNTRLADSNDAGLGGAPAPVADLYAAHAGAALLDAGGETLPEGGIGIGIVDGSARPPRVPQPTDLGGAASSPRGCAAPPVPSAPSPRALATPQPVGRGAATPVTGTPRAFTGGDPGDEPPPKKARKPKTQQQIEKDIRDMKTLEQNGLLALEKFDALAGVLDPEKLKEKLKETHEALSKSQAALQKMEANMLGVVRDGLVTEENDVTGRFATAQHDMGKVYDKVRTRFAVTSVYPVIAKCTHTPENLADYVEGLNALYSTNEVETIEGPQTPTQNIKVAHEAPLVFTVAKVQADALSFAQIEDEESIKKAHGLLHDARKSSGDQVDCELWLEVEAKLFHRHLSTALTARSPVLKRALVNQFVAMARATSTYPRHPVAPPPTFGSSSQGACCASSRLLSSCSTASPSKRLRCAAPSPRCSATIPRPRRTPCASS